MELGARGCICGLLPFIVAYIGDWPNSRTIGKGGRVVRETAELEAVFAIKPTRKGGGKQAVNVVNQDQTSR